MLVKVRPVRLQLELRQESGSGMGSCSGRGWRLSRVHQAVTTDSRIRFVSFGKSLPTKGCGRLSEAGLWRRPHNGRIQSM